MADLPLCCVGLLCRWRVAVRRCGQLCGVLVWRPVAAAAAAAMVSAGRTAGSKQPLRQCTTQRRSSFLGVVRSASFVSKSIQVGESRERLWGCFEQQFRWFRVCKGWAVRVSACWAAQSHAWAVVTATARRLAATAALRSTLLAGADVLPLAASGWPPGSGVPPSLQELPSTCMGPATAQDTGDRAPTSSQAHTIKQSC